MHPYFSYDASHAHRRGRGDKEKISHFLLVTIRPTAHSRRYVCIRNCVDGFGMDTGQSLVTTKECEITCVITKGVLCLYVNVHTKVYACMCDTRVNFSR